MTSVLRRAVARARPACAAAALPWIVTRVIVVATLAGAHLVVDHLHPGAPGVAARVHSGLLGWDAGWYLSIASRGYGALGHQSLRFFPLVPLLTRGIAALPGVRDQVALVGLSNLLAFAATAMLWALVRAETGDADLARRSVWILALAPSAVTYVMGYAESALLVCTVGCFLALRRRDREGCLHPAWGWAAIAGVAAGAVRPLGVVLVLPVLVEGLRHWRGSGTRRRAGVVIALLAPVAGVGAFLAWCAVAFGDFWLPVAEQTSAKRHGGLTDPLATLRHDAAGVLHHHVETALHVPFVVLAVALLVVCFRRWPSSYGLFAAGVLAAAVSGTNLDSFERYALSAFPLVLAAAGCTASPRVERVVLVLLAAGLVGYSLLVFVNIVVP